MGETLASERFDLLVLEAGADQLRNGAGAALLALVEKAPIAVVLVSPRS